ncbi:MAG: hypothetical protein ACOCVA_05120 [Prolixibacteraceae bacterium]
MSIKTKHKIINSYFNLMKDWDNDSKKELIIRLTKSIDRKKAGEPETSDFFGAWEDERSAQEIYEDIRADRVNKNQTEEF